MKKTNNPSSSLYFVNAFVDYTLMGAASILIYFFLKSFHDGSRSALVINLGVTLMWVINWPHFSATNFRLYRSRANMMQYPLTSFVIPFVVLAGVVGSCLYPEDVAPYFVKIFLIWSPYHFSGQSVGISLVYARRAGIKISPLTRFGLSAFVFGTFLTSTARAEAGLGDSTFYGVTVPMLGVPSWVLLVTQVIMFGGGLILLCDLMKWCLKNKKILPPIILLPSITQYIWFVQGSGWASFQEFVPLFHSLQYLLIAWSVQLKEKMGEKEIKPSRRYMCLESLRWGVINLVGGVALFHFFPYYVSSLGIPFSFAMGVTLAGVQIHHFFVDGVIWKLKNEKVSSPLMGHISHITGKTAVQKK